MRPGKSILLLPLLLLAGCTHFRVDQTDHSPNERTIQTHITGSAWFSSAQSLAKIKALQTDKTQSFGADALNQHGATNTAATLDALARLLQQLR